MNYFIKIITAIVFATLSINTYAQTIKTAINSEAANNVKFLNMESKKYFVHDAEYPEFEAMGFTFDNQKTIMKDVDFDGTQDAVSLLYYCEETNCHPTTKSVDLVVFKGLGKNKFTKLGSASLGVNAKINNIKNGVISITSYGYGESDPSCCPTDESKMLYKIKNKKLVKLD